MKHVKTALGLWALQKRAVDGIWPAALASLCWPWHRECRKGPRLQSSTLGFACFALAWIGHMVTQTTRRAGEWKMRRSLARSGSGSGWTQEGLCTYLQTHTQKYVHFQPWTWTQGFTHDLLRMKLGARPCRKFSQGLRVDWLSPSQVLGLPPASASGTCTFLAPESCSHPSALQITPSLKVRCHYKLNLIKVGYSSMPFCLLYISRVSSAHVRKPCSPPCKSMEESPRITSQ